MTARQQKNRPKLPKTTETVKSRRLKKPQYRSLRLSKRIKHPAPKLPSVLKLFRLAIKRLLNNWRLYGGIILIYGLLTVVLVRGLSSGLNLQELKVVMQQFFHGSWGQLTTGWSLFGVLLGSAGSSGNATAGLYQSVLMVLTSLVLIWCLRQQQAKQRLSLKEAFYKSSYPLIPFVLVLMVIGLQLVPLLIGNSVYSIVISNGIAVTAIEKVFWALLFFLLALLSLYMISSSLFALYIVTLPDMTPMRALRSARELVRFRRWVVLRKVVMLPILLILLAAVIMIPLILLLTPVAEWIFFGCTMLALALVHSYMYTLYRELL